MKKYILEIGQFCDESFDNGNKQVIVELTKEQVTFAEWLLSHECFEFVSIFSLDTATLDFQGEEEK